MMKGMASVSATEHRWKAPLAGVALLVGVAWACVAAFYPGLRSVWTTGGSETVRLIAHHRSGWQVANWSFAVGITFTMAGLAVITSLLRPRPYAALVFFAVTITLWIADLTFRLTVTVDVADRISSTAGIPDWYGPLWRWGDQGLMVAAALAAVVAVVPYAIAGFVSDRFAKWPSWWAAAIAAVIAVQAAVSRDVIPLLLYLAPAGFGVDLLVRRVRANKPSDLDRQSDKSRRRRGQPSADRR
jgi:hypothetical protein